jgi:phage tail sheath protein FI
VAGLKGRSLNSSFAAAYFPDVNVLDPTTTTLVTVPATVAVLGSLSRNDAVAFPWFAPAGTDRGQTSAVSTSLTLSKANLDKLYDARINPITSFPGTAGYVVWGQKTLQLAANALDRVNVRRLLIELRRAVRAVGNSLLFEPNREETLDRFRSLVNPILQSVQERSGVDRYRVVIDTSTTTQADIENNTIRGQIFIQPTRSVEFVSLSFEVSNAGTF